MSPALPWRLFLLLQAASQDASPEVEAYRETFRRIVREALSRGEAFSKLERLCSVAPLRLSGSPGAVAAVEWAKEAMKRDGLENVRLEPVTVPRWERGAVAELRILAPAEAAGESLPILALGGSVGTPPEGIEAPLLEVKSFEELRASGERAKGRIVFFNRPMDPSLPDPFEAYSRAVDQR
ncbi:MAG: peptidase M28 family protein, partial [Planctomycetota bacterium]